MSHPTAIIRGLCSCLGKNKKGQYFVADFKAFQESVERAVSQCDLEEIPCVKTPRTSNTGSNKPTNSKPNSEAVASNPAPISKPSKGSTRRSTTSKRGSKRRKNGSK